MSDLPKIYMFCPTVRPTMMMDTIKDWIAKSSGTIDIAYTIDAHNRSKSITQSITNHLKHLNCEKDTDIISFIADDLYPPQNWDIAFVSETKDYCGAVQFKDNIRRGNPLVTTCCITYGALKKINRCHVSAEYYHCYSDNECYDNLTELGLLKDVSETNPIEFEHRHFIFGTRERDETDIKAWDMFPKDQETYLRRKTLTVQQRLGL
jgi:hypothetical protein